MISISDEELLLVVAGASTSSSLINAISKMMSTLLDFGRSIGSAIRYAISGKKC